MQDEYIKPIAVHLRDRLKPDARAKYDTLAPNLQDMYRLEKCAMCNTKVTANQAGNCIMKGLPLICPAHSKTYNDLMIKAAPLLGQLSLL